MEGRETLARELAFRAINDEPGSCGITRAAFDKHWDGTPGWYGISLGKRLAADLDFAEIYNDAICKSGFRKGTAQEGESDADL